MNNVLDQNEPVKEFSYSYKKIQASKIIADPSYNRGISRTEVSKILANFDPNLVNPIKVSYRDNKYFVFDGNHTLKALIERANGDDSICVDCKVYTGMTKQDEAKMFALQFGESRKVSNKFQVRALYVAEDPEVVRFKNAVMIAGAKCNFVGSQQNYHIICYDTAFKIFKQRGEAHFITVIKTIIGSWNGSIESLRKEIICGMDILISTFPDINTGRLVRKLSLKSPAEIISKGKSDQICKGNNKYAIAIGAVYNENLGENSKLDLTVFR